MRIERGECTAGAAAACLLSPARMLSDQNKNNRLEASLLPSFHDRPVSAVRRKNTLHGRCHKKESRLRDSRAERGRLSDIIPCARVLHPTHLRCVGGFLTHRKSQFPMSQKTDRYCPASVCLSFNQFIRIPHPLQRHRLRRLLQKQHPLRQHLLLRQHQQRHRLCPLRR